MTKTALIIHGTEGYPEENWFPWIKLELEKLGYTVLIPQFPTPPVVPAKISEWFDVFNEIKEQLNEESILIGHSLGGVFTLRILEKIDHTLKAVFLTGTPVGEKPILFYDRDVSFSGFKFNWDEIKSKSNNFHVYHSDTDPFVGLENGKKLAENLDIDLTFIPNAGHFNKKAGYLKFEKLLNDIKKSDKPKKVMILASMHGNETYGEDIYARFIEKYPLLKDNVYLVIGNKEARERLVRFIDEDLNRVFNAPDSKKVHEITERDRLLKTIDFIHPDYILDVHTTKRASNKFVITDSLSGSKLDILNAFEKYPICLMKDDIVHKSFIGNNKEAVSIEYSLVDIDQETLEYSCDSIMRLVTGQKAKSDYKTVYEVHSLVKKPELNKYKKLINFQKYHEGTLIMAPEDESQMDAEYFGFWADEVKRRV